MGEAQSTLFQPEFNRSIHVESRRERLSADGGAILLRELLHRLGLDGWLTERLGDARDPARTVHPSEELLRTLVLLQGQGWSEQADVTGLREDPAFRLAVSSRKGDRPLRPAREGGEPEGLCSQPTLSRYLEGLSSGENRTVLDEALREGADRRHGLRHRGPLREATLDLDSLAVEVWGHQPGTAYNGHFRCRCYHPLVLRWDRGDFLAARLRPGNAHTADGGHSFALPTIRWARQRVRTLWLRIDAGFPSPEFLQAVEAEGIRYVARLRTNAALERKAKPHLRRPPGRPPRAGRTWLHELSYRAGTWQRARRVVLVVLERPEWSTAEDGTEQLHLFLDHFFLLTNAPAEEVRAEDLLARYRGRGQAEKDFGDWKSTLRLRLSSSPRPNTHYRGRRLRDPYSEAGQLRGERGPGCSRTCSSPTCWIWAVPSTAGPPENGRTGRASVGGSSRSPSASPWAADRSRSSWVPSALSAGLPCGGKSSGPTPSAAPPSPGPGPFRRSTPGLGRSTDGHPRVAPANGGKGVPPLGPTASLPVPRTGPDYRCRYSLSTRHE